jgi:hypothetical protein
MTHHPIRVTQILGELGLSETFFPSETPADNEAHTRRIIRFIAFRQGRIDSQLWIGDMDGEKEMPQILSDVIINRTLYRPIDGLDRSAYHQVFLDMALMEGATGLDMTSHKQLSRAVGDYWQAVKKTIQIFKLQYQVRREHMETALQVTTTLVDAPPLAMADPEVQLETEEETISAPGI